MFHLVKRLSRFFVPAPLRRQIRRLRSLARDIWLPVYRLEHAGLTLIQIGRESLDPYIVRSLCGEYHSSARIGGVPIWNLERAVRRWEATADLIFFRHGRFRPPAAMAGRMLVLPYYVQQIVDVPSPTADLRAHLYNGSTKADLDRIRKAGFQYEIARDPELLEYFYHHVYVPYVEQRHLESAEVYPWPRFQAIYQAMELLLVRQDGRIVAGNVNQQIGRTYRLHVTAALSADRESLKTGVVSALYWFSFVEAHHRGCLEVDLGAARPFLKDGVLVYKKKWNSRIAASIYKRNLGLWCLPCGNRPSVCRALEDNPFFCEYDGGLVGLIFLGGHTVLNDEELARYLKRSVFPGERLSFRIVLLSRDWAARIDAIRRIVAQLPQSARILDLSNGSLAELPGRLRDVG